jgi:hypothetical protein
VNTFHIDLLKQHMNCGSYMYVCVSFSYQNTLKGLRVLRVKRYTRFACHSCTDIIDYVHNITCPASGIGVKIAMTSGAKITMTMHRYANYHRSRQFDWLIDWLVDYGFTSRSRIFHLCGDVTITYEGLQNLGLCSALRAIEQGGIFIVSHLLWHGTSFFPVSFEGPPHLVASYDIRGGVADLF